MSPDLRQLLTSAADDSDQPLREDVSLILTRGRRSVRRRRLAAAATAALATAAVIGGVATWSVTQVDGEGPAGAPEGETFAVDVKTGRIINPKAGQDSVPPPPVSPLSDAEVLNRCKPYDKEQVDFLRRQKANLWDQAGPIDGRWKVVVKSGDQNRLSAIFLSPDQSIASTCDMSAPGKPITNGRLSTTMAPRPGAPDRGAWPQVVTSGVRSPEPVEYVLVSVTGEPRPRQALVGTDRFYTIGSTDLSKVSLVRGFDAKGMQVYVLDPKADTKKYTPPPVDPKVTFKTAPPIEPVVILSKDPETGKPFAAAPPVSPLSDDEVRDRCRRREQDLETDPAYRRGQREQDPREQAAGPINSSWSVALKTGTGDKLTTVLVAPDRRVVVWCHLTAATSQGGDADYTRSAVQADGTFGDRFEWGIVPTGVAQLVVDLPTKGPTRALISNGLYIWGLTGGNSAIKSVRVRGYDAQGKLVYDQQRLVDAD